MTAQLPPYEDPELLARALERTPICPSVDLLAAAALGGLAEDQRAEILAHAEDCPSCGAELELARSFDRDPGADSAQVDEVVSRLRGGAAPNARVLSFPGSRAGAPRPRLSGWTRWAAAALVVVGVGLVYQATRVPQPPELGSPSSSGVLRGGEIETLTPVGTVDGSPAELSWRPVEGAASYEVEILDVAGEPIAQLEVAVPRAELAPEQRALLRERARYGWRVVARDANGSEIARSATTEFEVRPAG